MVKYGNYTDGWVAFNCKDNLIQGGYNSEVTFFIKRDGSSSFGGGLNGQSFKALTDTPNKIKDGKLLGGCGKGHPRRRNGHAPCVTKLPI